METKTSDAVRLPRPGGLKLTERAISLCRLETGDGVLDVGCGPGESVAYMRERRDLRAVGIDRCAETLAEAPEEMSPHLIEGDAHALPFSDDKFDAVFFECSLSKMDDPDMALCESFRVLRPGGSLAVSDFFTTGGVRMLSGVLGRMETRAHWAKRLRTAGFEIEHEEDRTGDLRALWGQLVFQYGLERMLAVLYPDGQALSGDEIGYFLTVARKRVKSDGLSKV